MDSNFDENFRRAQINFQTEFKKAQDEINRAHRDKFWDNYSNEYKEIDASAAIITTIVITVCLIIFFVFIIICACVLRCKKRERYAMYSSKLNFLS